MTANKLHFGPLKPEKPFLTVHGTMNNADLAFYEGYDPNFIWRKAVALFGIYSNAASFKESAASWEWPVDSTDEMFLGAVAAEIHCASFHQIEGLLALLFAEYQNRPDWVYLTSYGSAEMKKTARALVKGDFEQITDGAHKTASDFVSAAVFAGFRPEDSEHNEDWRRSVSDIGWLIAHCAKHFVEGNEYNAYKHGLRVVSGSASLALRPTGETGPFVRVVSMKHSLSFLEISEEPEGYTGECVTKELSPNYSYNLIAIIANVLTIIREMRLARIRGINLDREKLLSTQPHSRMSFSF
jgi:hypothetical protein